MIVSGATVALSFTGQVAGSTSIGHHCFLTAEWNKSTSHLHVFPAFDSLLVVISCPDREVNSRNVVFMLQWSSLASTDCDITFLGRDRWREPGSRSGRDVTCIKGHQLEANVACAVTSQLLCPPECMAFLVLTAIDLLHINNFVSDSSH